MKQIKKIPTSHARNSKIRSRERGQSLVELGLSLVVMLMLLTGAVEFGLALFQYVTMRDAAQEGALYGSINPFDADDTALPYSTNAQELRNRVIASANDIVQLSEDDDIEVTINGDDCEGLTSGVPHSITVRITFSHPITMPLVTPILGTNTINLSTEVTDTILQPAC